MTADLVNEPAFDASIDIHDSYLAKQHPGEDGNSAFLDSIIVPVGDLGVLQVMKSPAPQWDFNLIGCATRSCEARVATSERRKMRMSKLVVQCV